MPKSAQQVGKAIRSEIVLRIHRIAALLRLSDPCWAECLLALIMIAYGGWLMLPFDTFGQAMAYRDIRTMFSEGVWGGIMGAIGLFQIWVIGGTNNTERLFAANLNTFFWIFFAGCAWHSSPTSGGVPIFTIYAVASQIALLRRRASA